MPLKRIARVSAWLVGSCLLLVIGVYLVIVAINWRDEPPSPDAQALTHIIRDRPPVADKDNAFVLLLGMTAPLDQDPFAQGQMRRQFLDDLAPWKPGDGSTYLPGRELPYEAARTPAITALANACKEGNAACVQQVRDHPEEVTQWLASEAWLLDRYMRLVQLREWRGSVLQGLGAPTPSHLPALHGQQLLLMQAWQHARNGEGDATRALLQQDMDFWRMVLRSSDMLITKMVATAAIERNFAIGNLALRDLHDAGKPAMPPDAWLSPISPEERSILRPMAGEWMFQTASMGPIADAFGRENLRGRIARPTFQVQATNNLLAWRMHAVARRFNADYRALPQVARAPVPPPPRSGGVHRAYNLYGYIVYGIGADFDDANYGVRVSDLEGERRAVLLAVALRDAGATPADALRRIQSSQLKDPYTGQPFDWSPGTQGIVFTGLAKGTRARHEWLL